MVPRNTVILTTLKVTAIPRRAAVAAATAEIGVSKNIARLCPLLTIKRR